jgi:hypothetical protein
MKSIGRHAKSNLADLFSRAYLKAHVEGSSVVFSVPMSVRSKDLTEAELEWLDTLKPCCNTNACAPGCFRKIRRTTEHGLYYFVLEVYKPKLDTTIELTGSTP